ncbi:MAG: hypothetical protein DHS80DRAFT_22408 [Piptocephalis tieghemiana]|nr:MAG: hypothetical protein DHS80DRAFT_22408 [Piptocephalis tieghemiana]
MAPEQEDQKNPWLSFHARHFPVGRTTLPEQVGKSKVDSQIAPSLHHTESTMGHATSREASSSDPSLQAQVYEAFSSGWSWANHDASVIEARGEEVGGAGVEEDPDPSSAPDLEGSPIHMPLTQELIDFFRQGEMRRANLEAIRAKEEALMEEEEEEGKGELGEYGDVNKEDPRSMLLTQRDRLAHRRAILEDRYGEKMGQGILQREEAQDVYFASLLSPSDLPMYPILPL